MEQRTYAAFISYRHQSPDQEIAKALHTAIETYGIPAAVKKQTGIKRMGKVFRDQEELPLSADLGADIETALLNSEWFIAICSPRYLESRWCLREMEFFIAHKGREHVLTVLTEGEPQDSFPDIIRFVETEEGKRIEAEPLAASVRAATLAGSLKALKGEKLRILAPMLGLSYDDLKRRARQRRIRIGLSIGAATLAAAAGLTVFIVANHMRSEALKREAAEQAALAEEQRRIAEEEQRRAEEERRTAVLSDIGERLERAETALSGDERSEAAKILIDTLAISDENGQVRHDEIVALLRRTMYIEPFTVVSSFHNQNMQMLFITPSPDGTRAIGIVNSNSIAMVDLLQNEILYTVTVDNSLMINPCFSQDGTRFMVNCDYGRFVQVWNTADGSEAFSYVSKNNAQYEIANQFFWKDADTIFVQDADRFLLVSADGTERLFYTYGEQMDDYDRTNNLISRIDGRSLDEIFTQITDSYYGIKVLVSDDRERVAIVGKTGETAVIVLDGEGRRIFLPDAPVDPGCKMPGTSLDKWALSPDGRTLCCVTRFWFIAGWDTDTKQMIFIDALDCKGDELLTEPAFTADSKRMAYTVGNQLYVADARTHELALSATIDTTNYIPSLSFTDDGKYLLMTNNSMFIINTETWALELMNGAEKANYNALIALEDMVLCGRYDGIIYLYSLPSLSAIRTAETFDAPLAEPYLPDSSVPCVPLIGEHQLSETFKTANYYKDYPNKLCFSRDGKTAALAYPDGVIELFDTDGDGKVKEMIAQVYTYVQALAVTEDRLIASSVDGRLLVYDLNMHVVDAILQNDTIYGSFAFDAAGDRMLAMTQDQTRIDLFALNDGCRLLLSMKSGDSVFTDMAFSADEAYAVAKTGSGTYRIADLYQDEAALIKQAKRMIHQD